MKTKSQEKNTKAGLAIIHYHGSSIVINSTDAGELKILLTTIDSALYHVIRYYEELGWDDVANKYNYIHDHFQVALNNIVEL